MKYPDKQLDLKTRKRNKSLVFHLALFSISFLFTGMVLAYGYQILLNNVESYVLPWMFYINTLVLFTVSFILYRTRNAAFPTLLRSSVVVLFLIMLFFILQCVAWWQLFEQLESTSSHNGIQFLYLLSIFHSLHVLAGLPFHISYIRQARLYPVLPTADKSLLDQKFYLIHKYWHFLDILWAFLMLVFILHMILK